MNSQSHDRDRNAALPVKSDFTWENIIATNEDRKNMN